MRSLPACPVCGFSHYGEQHVRGGNPAKWLAPVKPKFDRADHMRKVQAAATARRRAAKA